MKSKNTVAATLALLAMIGFLAIFAVLGFIKVPPENKDFFNMGFIALIGFVGTAFGYYLGSSLGSAQKNAIIERAANPPQAAPPPPADKEAGFASLRFILPLSFMAALLFGVAGMNGCAPLPGDSPQAPAAASAQPSNPVTPYAKAAQGLRLARSGIITTAKTADTLCTQGVLNQTQCDQVKAVYGQMPRVCEAVSAGILLWLDTGYPEEYDKAAIDLAALATQLAGIIKPYQGGAK